MLHCRCVSSSCARTVVAVCAGTFLSVHAHDDRSHFVYLADGLTTPCLSWQLCWRQHSSLAHHLSPCPQAAAAETMAPPLSYVLCWVLPSLLQDSGLVDAEPAFRFDVGLHFALMCCGVLCPGSLLCFCCCVLRPSCRWKCVGRCGLHWEVPLPPPRVHHRQWPAWSSRPVYPQVLFHLWLME